MQKRMQRLQSSDSLAEETRKMEMQLSRIKTEQARLRQMVPAAPLRVTARGLRRRARRASRDNRGTR